MQILAHRGVWHNIKEKNTLGSLANAFKLGFGVETDIRDYNGKLVISHNIADADSPVVEKMFAKYMELKSNSILALNVKADGIQKLLMPLLNLYKITNYFLFDMSIPEMVVYEREKLIFYTRNSDIEEECVMYEQATGVWLDSFYVEGWLTVDKLNRHLSSEKKISIISPEIHNLAHLPMWKMIRDMGYNKNPNIALCTDLPMEARSYFNE